MIEQEVKDNYSKTIEDANDVLLYDGFVDANLEPENITNVRSFTSDLIYAVEEWKRHLVLLRNKLKEIANELETNV